MSNRHLPAGQNMQGGVGGVPGIDMAGGPGGSRRRQPPPFVPQYHHQHMNPMYANYMPYGGPQQQYYGMPPQYQNGQFQPGGYQNGQYQAAQYQGAQYQAGQYQNGGMPSPGYMPYQNYARSPPSMQQYVPMAGVSIPPSYPRQAQQSPALPTPYQPPPPASAPVPSHTPSSTHSSQLPPPTPPTPQTTEQAPPVVPPREPSPVVEEKKEPFRPPLPWLSRPEVEFPAKTTKSRRRRRPLNADSQAVSLPGEQHEAVFEQSKQTPVSEPAPEATAASPHLSTVSVAPSETPTTQRQPAEEPAPATPTSSISQQHRSPASTVASATPTATSKTGRPAVPIPALPTLPKKDAKPRAEKPVNGEPAASAAVQSTALADSTATSTEPVAEANATEQATSVPVKPPPPSSWAKLFSKPATSASKTPGVNGTGPSGTAVGGVDNEDVNGSSNGVPGFSKANASSVAEAIHSYRVGGNDNISFLEPRGLINTGNMCYMNSVLQVLMFCVPFYEFLTLVSKRAVHSFKSDTPLVDAMIMFMHEYKIIKSATEAESLRRTLKNEELERYGEPFTPEFVYEAIRQLPRFASMRRGHQQDAEEFLGFLLQSLDDECTSVINGSLEADQARDDTASFGDGTEASGDWLEVGRKQRAAVTRSSGSNSSSPVTRIFGGLLRSEFRVPGKKDSITTEPYQPLQLDIGSPDVRNVVDALRGLTRPERIQGNFNSERGKDVTATKQVFIETLPPVLILHLKRFQFDAEGNGTVKIWKKIGYPLELEIPREVLSRKRQNMGDGALPKYKLISVVYHHGKNASGGHYTVDVRRQEGREWIRLDDTVIRRVRSEDVAEGGEEEEVKDTQKDGSNPGTSGNRFGAMMSEDGDEDGWEQVPAATAGNKRWSSVANGNSNGASKAKPVKDNIKDNKVAYLLFYQRV